MPETEEPSVSPRPPSSDGQIGIGCLGVFCALLTYWLTIGLADKLYADSGRVPLDPTGGLGMILAMGPPAWLAVVASAVLAMLKKGFLLTAGSGALVALVSLLFGWLALSG